MTSPPNPADSLWQFSIGFYADADVEARCLRLQNQWQCNVNYLLFALWHGLSGRGEISVAQFHQCRSATHDLEQSVIDLRALRKNMKTQLSAQMNEQGSELLHDYYRDLQRAELKGEQALQALLADRAQAPQCVDENTVIETARRNLDNYRNELAIPLDLALTNELDQLLAQAARFVRQVPIL